MIKAIFDKSSKIKLVLFLSGLIIPVLFAYFINKSNKESKRNMPFIALADYVRNNTTKGHLWLEELIAGDESIDLQKDILPLFEKSKKVLLSAKNTGDSEVGLFEKQDDENLKNMLTETITKLDELVFLTQKRYQFHELSKLNSDSINQSQNAGGAQDIAFDKTYEDIQNQMQSINLHIKNTIDEKNSNIKIISWILIILVAIVSIIDRTFINIFQTRNEKLKRQSEEKLKYENERLAALEVFLTNISNSNYDSQINTEFSSDTLAVKLEDLKRKLKYNSQEDTKRNWTNIGLAQMGEILRAASYKNDGDFYNAILKFCVKYVNAVQGALFLINDDNEQDIHLEMVSFYAYDRRKFSDKRIELGEGIVGQCYLEKEYTMLTEIPDKYTFITSGIGEATPNTLLVVPIKVDEHISGVLELSSFNLFEEFQVQLILKLAENIASSITNIRSMRKTEKLLSQTQQLTEEMRAQEEELRQNLEEMTSAQEEFQRKEQQYLNEIEQLKSHSA